MKQFIHIFLLLMLSICVSFSTFSQSDANKESEIQLLIISFQQKRYAKPIDARKDIEKAVEIAESISKKNYLVSTKVLLGQFYDDNNNSKQALSQYTEALDIAKKIKDVQGIASAEYNIGYWYHSQPGENQKKEALIHFNKAVKSAQKAKDKNLLAKSYNLVALSNYDLDELDKAETNAVNALILFRELKNERRMAQSHIILARVSNKRDEFGLAIEYLDSAIAIHKKTNNSLEANNALLTKAEIYLRKKEHKKAIAIAKDVEASPSVMADQKLYALELLYLINKSMNKTSASLDYLEETKNFQDSIFQLERDKLSESVRSELDAKIKLENLEKEAEIKGLQLQQSRYLTWALVGISVLLLLIALVSFLFYRQNKLKSEREKIKLEQESIQLEQKLLRTQMNPHFIANSLAAIQGNIYKQDKEKSVTYLSKFAKLMRFILESSREKEVLLEKEITSLINYLDLQKLLLEEKLTYSISVEEGLNTDEYKIPPMLIQPFIENAIVHGIELKSEPGTVTVSFEKKNENLQVIIEDDGLGREKVNAIYEKRKSSHLSFSTNITNERIEKMNTETKGNISSVTEDVVKNGEVCGTRVSLIVPLKSVF